MHQVGKKHAACNLAEPGLCAVVILASRTPCAYAKTWHGALRCLILSALLCVQEGSLRQIRCPLEKRLATMTGQTMMQQTMASWGCHKHPMGDCQGSWCQANIAFFHVIPLTILAWSAGL